MKLIIRVRSIPRLRRVRGGILMRGVTCRGIEAYHTDSGGVGVWWGLVGFGESGVM